MAIDGGYICTLVTNLLNEGKQECAFLSGHGILSRNQEGGSVRRSSVCDQLRTDIGKLLRDSFIFPCLEGRAWNIRSLRLEHIVTLFAFFW